MTRLGAVMAEAIMHHDGRDELLRRLANPFWLGALQRLDEQARKLERHAGGPSVENLIAAERDHLHAYGGRSVFGWEPPPEISSRLPFRR
jgi:hypothetical protein